MNYHWLDGDIVCEDSSIGDEFRIVCDGERKALVSQLAVGGKFFVRSAVVSGGDDVSAIIARLVSDAKDVVAAQALS